MQGPLWRMMSRLQLFPVLQATSHPEAAMQSNQEITGPLLYGDHLLLASIADRPVVERLFPESGRAYSFQLMAHEHVVTSISSTKLCDFLLEL